MVGFITHRLLLVVPVLLGLTLVTFTLMYLIPGDPAELLAGPTATQADVQALREKLGLDRPPVVRYFDYLGNLLQLDLGVSLRTGEPVITEIADRLPNTLKLAVLAISIASVIGLFVGIVAGVHRRTWWDTGSMTVSLLGVSTPVFWLGLLLILVFSVRLGWLPAAGSGSWKHLILPSITLGFRAMGEIARMSRADILEVLQEDYVRTARAKGLPERIVIWRHALRNALIPTITVIGLRFGSLLGGAVITELIFAWPGAGRLIVDAIAVRDFPVVQGTVLVMALTFLFVNLVVDIAYVFVDPRIQY